MIPDDLSNASESVLEIVVDQGERRLAAQCAFADAQDQRASAVVNASTALAGAAVALAAGAAASMKAGRAEYLSNPLVVGAAAAAVGFSIAATLALWALRSRGFHGAGYYPADFIQDVAAGKERRALLIDFALELQGRLSDNRSALEGRGDRFNAAAWTLAATPVFALVVAYVSG